MGTLEDRHLQATTSYSYQKSETTLCLKKMKLLILGAAALILIAGRCVLAQPAAMSDCGCNGENCEGWKFQEGATTLNKWNPGVYPPNGFKITATPADCRT